MALRYRLYKPVTTNESNANHLRSIFNKIKSKLSSYEVQAQKLSSYEVQARKLRFYFIKYAF